MRHPVVTQGVQHVVLGKRTVMRDGREQVPVNHRLQSDVHTCRRALYYVCVIFQKQVPLAIFID